MKLDRNINPDGTGKYALIKLRNIDDNLTTEIKHAGPNSKYALVVPAKVIDAGREKPFFVLRYQDKFAEPALRAYAQAVRDEATKIHASLYTSRLGDPQVNTLTAWIAELIEYASEIDREADAALRLALDDKAKLPD